MGYNFKKVFKLQRYKEGCDVDMKLAQVLSASTLVDVEIPWKRNLYVKQ